VRLALTLMIACLGSVAAAQYPYQYSYPYRMDWYNQQWALRNQQEFVRKWPDQSGYYYVPPPTGNPGFDVHQQRVHKYEHWRRTRPPTRPGIGNFSPMGQW
jgi:hypothetical protein